MDELSLREIQETELQLLLKFHEICARHGWRYSLSGGSLIGAVRHQGFIPWDDDVDVVMPRPDYDQFTAYCKTEQIPFGFVHYETVQGYHGLFARLWDRDTVVEDSVADFDFEFGISMDIFPVEGMGASREEALRIFRKTAWDRELLNAVAWKKYARSKTHGLWMEPIRFMMFVISRFVDPVRLLKKVDRVNRSHPFETSEYAASVCGVYRTREIMPRKVFSELRDTQFEGHTVKIMQDYDTYLGSLFGDYMTLPPEHKRVSHHTFRAYRKHTEEEAKA